MISACLELLHLGHHHGCCGDRDRCCHHKHDRHHGHGHHHGHAHHHEHDHSHCGCHAHHGALAHADIGVVAVRGERRLVAFRVENKARTAIDLAPALSPVIDLGTGAALALAPWSVAPGTITPIAPDAAVDLLVRLDTDGLEYGHTYRAALELGGTRIPSVEIIVAVEHPAALVGRHDVSRLREWIEAHCFADRPTALRAWGQRLGGGHHAHHGCCPSCCGGHGHPHTGS